jgi:hypothetical protein
VPVDAANDATCQVATPTSSELNATIARRTVAGRRVPPTAHRPFKRVESASTNPTRQLIAIEPEQSRSCRSGADESEGPASRAFLDGRYWARTATIRSPAWPARR